MTTKTFGGRSGADYPGNEDAYLMAAFPNGNYSSDSRGEIAVIRFTGLSNIVGPVTVTDAYFTMYASFAPVAAATTSFKRVLRAWVEAQATWNNYATGSAWATAGCLGDGTDRVAANSCVVSYPGGYASADYSSTSNTQLIADVEGMINGTLTNNGWHFSNSGSGVEYGLPGNTTAAQRPLLTVIYTAASRLPRSMLLGVG